MRLVRLQWGLALLLAIGIFGFSHAHAAVSYNVGVCDPKAPPNCIKPAADGSIVVTGGGGGSLSATANTNPQTGTDGQSYPLSLTTVGRALRITPNDPVTGKDVSFNDVTVLAQSLSPTLNASVVVQTNGGLASVGGYISGIAGGAQFTIQGSKDYDANTPANSHWQNLTVYQNDVLIPTSILTADGPFRAGVGTYNAWRILTSTGGTGTPAVGYTMSTAPTQVVAIIQPPTSSIRGAASSTDTAAHTLFASAGTGFKNYLTGLQCTNSSATASDITLNDSSSWSLTIPATGGLGMTFNPPLATAAATALTFTMGTGVSTVKCNSQGYTGL